MSDRVSALRRATLEVVAISLGIFGGLAADEWRVSRAEALEASEYVQRLVGDLRTDSSFLAVQVAAVEAAMPALERLRNLERLEDSAAAAQVASDLVLATQWSWSAIPLRRQTMDELVSSGDLILLSASLRGRLGMFYTAAEVWESILLRRRSDSGLARISARYVRIQRFPDGMDRAEPLSLLEEEAILEALDLRQLRLEATAELNTSRKAAQYLASLLAGVEELLRLLPQETR